LNQKPKCRFLWLILFWLVFIPWFIFSYFFGENSLITYASLKATYAKLLKEKDYWEERNEILREKIESLEKNKNYYYHKLAREMFLKGKKGEETILFVK